MPHNFDSTNSFVYTGTHDNDTLIGWIKESGLAKTLAEAQAREQVQTGEPAKKKDLKRADLIADNLIKQMYDSDAGLVIVPVQDILGLGSEARMNTPSVNGDNWCWRFDENLLRPELSEKLALLAELSDRLPQPITQLPDDNFAA